MIQHVHDQLTLGSTNSVQWLTPGRAKSATVASQSLAEAFARWLEDLDLQVPKT
jgi:hypothetical protein